MSYPGITNHGPVSIPGTVVVAYFGIKDSKPDEWIYSLWDENDDLLSTGALDFAGLTPTPEQVARVAFILDLEHGSDDDF